MQVDYATWFGANVEYIHGIQILPVTPVTELLLAPAWVREQYPVLAPALATASDGWKGFIYADLAVRPQPWGMSQGFGVLVLGLSVLDIIPFWALDWYVKHRSNGPDGIQF